jgi:hypothetical protein
MPTWNYVAVHAYGPVEFSQDPERLLDAVTRLTKKHEGSRAKPWAVSDAPADSGTSGRHANWISPRRTRALPAFARPFSRRFKPLSSGDPVSPAAQEDAHQDRRIQTIRLRPLAFACE